MRDYYITAESDGTKIDRDARIHRVSSKPEAISRLQDCYKDDEVIDIVEGDFGDAFAKLVAEPDEYILRTISEEYGVEVDHLRVQPPGTHPGGKMWWVQVTEPVYVAVLKVNA